MKLLALSGAAIVALGMAACGGKSSSGGTTSTGGAKKTVKVGLAYDIGGRGDKSFNDAAAATLKSKVAHVGFVGGCLVDLIKKFQAGYEAGAKAVNPAVKIEVNYLSTTADKCSGFNDPAKGETTAEGMYDAGADVV